MKIAHHAEVTMSTCAAERFIIVRVQLDALLVEIPHDVEMTASHTPGRGLRCSVQ